MTHRTSATGSRYLLPEKYRWLGALPLVFFAYAAVSYEHLWELLWLCNVANVVLALALLCRSLWWLWLATLCLLIGAPLWLLDLFVRGGLFPHSFLTHIAAPCLGVWLLCAQPAVRGVWKFALLFGIAVQLVARIVTPAELNINLSHAAYVGFSGVLGSYPVYWTGSVLLVGISLLALEYTLGRVATARRQGKPSGHYKP